MKSVNEPDPPGRRHRLPTRRGGWRRALGCVALGCVLTACGSTVPGRPTADPSTPKNRHIGTALATLLPKQDQFPSPYAAVVPPAEQAAHIAGDLSGIPPGATVDPADCAPPQRPTGPDTSAVVVGTDAATRTTLTVLLTRVDTPLSTVRQQARGCGTVHVRRGPITDTVLTQPDPAPPVRADDTFALHRTVTGPATGPGLTRSMRTLLAQVGDVRIEATAMSYGDGPSDPAGLDQVFVAAVEDVRAG